MIDSRPIRLVSDSWSWGNDLGVAFGGLLQFRGSLHLGVNPSRYVGLGRTGLG